MLNKLRSEDEGFTLIELLVVILIIGVLAAIALPTFLGQRDKAQDSSAKSDVRNAVTQLESCLVDAEVADCDDTNVLRGVAIVEADGAGTAYTRDSWRLTATSETENTFSITKDGAPGTYTRSCNVPATGAPDGGCDITADGATSGAGTW